ncbi:MAG: hypothetical protein R2845_07840 [Thermomicrobiales bacterium]
MTEERKAGIHRLFGVQDVRCVPAQPDRAEKRDQRCNAFRRGDLLSEIPERSRVIKPMPSGQSHQEERSGQKDSCERQSGNVAQKPDREEEREHADRSREPDRSPRGIAQHPGCHRQSGQPCRVQHDQPAKNCFEITHGDVPTISGNTTR